MSGKINRLCDFLIQSLKKFASVNDLYVMSVYLFLGCAAIGVIVFVACTISKKARGASVRWCFSLYTFAFMTDIFLCFTECEFSGKYFISATVAYLYCFVKYMLLIALYALVLLQRFMLGCPETRELQHSPVIEEPIGKVDFSQSAGYCGGAGNNCAKRVKSDSERQYGEARTFSDAVESGFQKSVYEEKRSHLYEATDPTFCGRVTSYSDKNPCGNIAKNRQAENNMRFADCKNIDSDNKKPLSVSIIDAIVNKHAPEPRPDVNVAYIRGIIEKLRGKEITSDEKEQLDDLDLALRQTLSSDPQSVRALNADLLDLVKKMTKYDVVI